jgi:hypothetical protein
VLVGSREWLSSQGVADLNALDGSTYTDGEGVTWDVSVDAAASAPNFGVHATDGLGIDGTGSVNGVYAYLTATIAEMVAVGGGHTYDPHTDAVEIWIEYAGLSFSSGCFTYAAINHHSGANRHDGIGGWRGATIERAGSVDDNTSAAATVYATDATFGADGVFAWRMAGTEIGCGYTGTAAMGDDFDALTENVSGNKYLGMAVRQGAGDSDAAVPTVQIIFVSTTLGATVQRVTRVRVRRWRGVAS